MTCRALLDGHMLRIGAEIRDGNGPREVEMWYHGENV